MASNNDNPGKGGARPAADKPSAEAGKKPTALIDLKPNEVDIKDPAKAAAAAKAEVAAGASAEAPKAAATAAQAAAKAAGEAAKPGAAPAAGKPAGTAGAAAAAGSGGSAAAPKVNESYPRPVSSGGGLRAAATHLVAGLAGGLLALFGSDALMTEFGRAPSGQAAMPAQLEARLKTLEAAGARPGSAELTQRLASAEARLQEIDRAARQIGEAQSQLAGETKSLGEKVSAVPTGAGADAERLARLEETLTTLATAAKDDPQRGRIPQLAQIAAKLTDLESSLNTQITQLRKAVTQEVDSRLSQSADAAQAARAGTQRLDRELAGVKNETAQVTQRLDGLKAQSDKFETALKGLGEATTALKGEIAREMSQVARSSDVNTALSPLSAKLSMLEQNVQGVVRGEDDRRQNVERIVTALELGNLKRTIDRGVAFQAELSEVRRVAGPKMDLSVLERFKDRGVPSLGDLEREFKNVAFAIIDADRQPAEAHWTDRLIASAKSVVRVRKLDQGAEDKGVEAVVARMEQALKGGRLAQVTAEAATLSAQARGAGKSWLDKVEARAAVERAIGAVEQELKASLGAQGQAGRKG